MGGENSSDNDFYEILGVSPAASEADIAGAYRALARAHHPDVAGGDEEKLAKFKRINQAYEVLSDENTRRHYDRRRSQASPRRPTPFSATPDRPMADPFGPLFQWASPFDPRPERRAMEIELPIAPEEARFGARCEFRTVLRRPCGGCQGTGRTPQGLCGPCQGEGAIQQPLRVQITIPAGARSGTAIRIAGRELGSAEEMGDLIVRLKIQPYW